MNSDTPDITDACLDLETLAALADGSLVDPARASAETHAAACASCRQALRELVTLIQDEAEQEPAPADLATRIVRTSIEEGAATEPPHTQGGVMHRFRLPIAAAALVLVGLGLFAWTGTGEERPVLEDPVAPAPVLVGVLPEAPAAKPGTAVVPARPADLGGERRFLAHLQTDKPVYRPGETLRARAVVLDAFTRLPVPGQGQAGQVQILGARGQVVYHAGIGIKNGVAGIEWPIPRDQAGGSFTLATSFPSLGMTETTHEFDVRAFRTPRLKTDLQFLRKAYGPGDEVRATLEAERAEGGIPSGATVTAIARLDGAEVWRKALALDAAGRVDVAFALPKTIEDGIGTLALRVEDGGVVETTAKTLPIVMNKVDLAWYPEGGDLIAGVPCGLYFEARTPRDEPADVAGVIIDDGGNEVATFSSVHEGRGRTAFIPHDGRTYRAVLREPAGIDDPVLLPVVKGTGVSLRASKARFDHTDPITVAVASTKDTPVTVGLFVRERELALKTVQLTAGTPAQVTLTPERAGDGVLRVTVFDDAGMPLAERLVLRRPRAALQLEVEPSVAQTVPGGTVEVGVRALDKHGRPVPGAVVGMSVTDDAVLATVDPRERAARLPVQALLGAEVKELRDPTAYLDGDAESAAHVDLLLATQGWRRFCFQDATAFREAQGELADRALAWRTKNAQWWGVTYTSWDGAIGIGGGGGGFVDLTSAADININGAVEPMAAADGAAFPEPVDAPMADEPGAMAGDRPKVLEAENMDQQAQADVMERQRAALLEELLLKDRANLDPPAPGAPMPEPEPTPNEHVEVDNDLPVDEVVADKEIEDDAEEGIEEVRPGAPAPFEPPAIGVRERRKLRFFEVQERGRGIQPMRWWRQYAHKRDPASVGTRSDFTETVFWHVGLVTDDDGRATFAFDTSDSITTLKLRADAFDRQGGLAATDATIEVKRPFYAEPKFPLEVAAGDQVMLPIMLVNGTDADLPLAIRIELGEGMALMNAAAAPTVLPANSSLRHRIPLQVHDHRGAVPLRIRVTAGRYEDDVVRRIQVVPPGFPMEHSFGGILEGVAQHEVTVPDSVIPGSLTTQVQVYPTPLASMAEALAAMLREPHGCFEQTSSVNYPNVMAMQYMQSHHGVDPAFVKKAAALLDRGYRKLVGFECKERGYEWFGGDPGHEALTAYGVLEFHDMAQVMNVDAEMVKRTRRWLLERRDGEGGFKRNERALDTFGRAPALTTNAYILWALAEVGETGLEKELRAFKRAVRDSKDTYVLALAANVFHKTGDTEEAARLRKQLAGLQAKDGSLPGATTSITGSGGRSLVIETSALAVLAWLQGGEQTREIEAAMRWISAQCQGGRFGSTQATILALKAVIAYDKARAQVAKDGTLELLVDGEVRHTLPFQAGQKQALTLPDLGETLGTGTHKLALRMQGGGVMPYSMVVRFHAMTPASADQAPLAITTKLATEKAVEGEPVEMRVEVRNVADKGRPMAVAIVGLPGGLEARAKQLEELVKEGKVDAIETRAREVILYWRSLAPKAHHTLTIDCVAAVPGRYEAPASRAYLYYTDEDKRWVAGTKLEITSR